MLPGPDIIRSCPQCQRAFRRRSLASGNTLGGKLWSDGSADYPMLPAACPVLRCPACGHLFWEEEQPVLARLDWRGTDPAPGPYDDAPTIFDPPPEDLEEAVGLGLWSTEEQETTLRLEWWHTENLPYRGASEAPPPPLGAEASNLRRLLDLVDRPFLLACVAHDLGDAALALEHLGGVPTIPDGLLETGPYTDDVMHDPAALAEREELFETGLPAAALDRMRALVDARDRRVVLIDREGA